MIEFILKMLDLYIFTWSLKALKWSVIAMITFIIGVLVLDTLGLI
ncbi:hypothetical protein [Cetobacterium sp.]